MGEGSLVGWTVAALGGGGARTLGACSWRIQLFLLVALVGNEREREEGSLRPGMLARLGAVVTCSWWWRSFLWVRGRVGGGVALSPWWWVGLVVTISLGSVRGGGVGVEFGCGQ